MAMTDGIKKVAPKVIDIGETIVTGKVQKPEVMYILTRGDIRIKEMDIKYETFVPKILQSVKKNPF